MAWVGIMVCSNVFFLVVHLLWFLSFPIHIGLFIIWILLMVKTYNGEKLKLPIIGDMAERQAALS
jgi:uncharacterized membrane protein